MRRSCLVLLLFVAFPPAALALPNVVVIFADDLGYGELGWGYTEPQPTRHDPPILFHVEHDPGERYDVAGRHPEVLEEIVQRVVEHRKDLKLGESQLAKQADGPVGVFGHPAVKEPR